MAFQIELAALGILLLVGGAFGLAIIGRIFRQQDEAGDRFFSTSLSAVALVYAYCGGIFWSGKAAAGISDGWGLAAGVAAALFAVAASMTLWRLAGPRRAAEGAVARP